MSTAPAAVSSVLFLSGFSSLIFEVVWERWLELRFGVTTYAAAVIVASFMGGMALGAVLLGRLADRIRRPLALYGSCELGIGLYALLMPTLLRLSWATDPRATILLLAVPAVLMGGTLPSLCRHAAHMAGRPLSFSWLYGVNILGGVIGSLAAAFVLLEALGTRATNALAAVISITVGALCLALSTETPRERPAGSPSASQLGLAALGFVLGFIALATEVLWFRALRLVIGGTVYSFGTMLSTCLLGFGIGSVLVSRLPRLWSAPLPCIGATQLWASLLFALGFPAFQTSWHMLAFFQRAYFSALQDWQALRTIHFAIAGAVMLGPAVLMGMALPLVVQALRAPSSARAIGFTYGLNSLGAVCGSLAAGFLLIPRFGLEASGRLVCGLSACLGIGLLLAGTAAPRALLAAAPAAVGLLLSWHGFFGAARPGLIYRKDGVVSTIQVYVGKDGRKVLETDNLDVQGMDPGRPLTHPKRLGYLPLLLHAGRVDQALQIGLGTGINLSALAQGAAKVTVVELIPEMPEAAAQFRKEAGDVLSRPNVSLVIDDGRHRVQASVSAYDLIVADLFYPENAGTGALFSVEHFHGCRRALRPGGTMVQWIPAHQMSLESLKTLAASFLAAFPDASLWWGTEHESIPTIALVGRTAPADVSAASLRAKMAALPGLHEVGWRDPRCLPSLRIMSPRSLAEFSRGAPLHTDDKPRIEYEAPRLETRRGTALFETLMALADRLEAEGGPDPEMSRLSKARAAVARSRAWRSAGREAEHERERRRGLALAPECSDLRL